jgi:hypothetical protein
MLSERVTPPMNSQKPGRAMGHRAEVVDMSKMTPAAPPCITSTTNQLGYKVTRTVYTVQVREVGRHVKLVDNRTIKTSVHKFEILHNYAIEVLRVSAAEHLGGTGTSYYMILWSTCSKYFVPLEHSPYSRHCLLPICLRVAHGGCD